ncbi:uncharacterized protein LOC108030116 isoform X2 [Drosophila biarmipes]|uniref:uncharacterized protein LOC108030116 isoform X2 n=1 Tax=Drosophila biarmipes TaxID=125945 RepID=UPI0007E60F37|nr:uncharacterized protein LOC108030116 isoform X2 [Drosophila biarmipes]
MSFSVINFLFTFLVLVPGILGQCIECKARGKFHCQTNYTGYYCAPGAYINENAISEHTCNTSGRTYKSPFSACTPYPFEISSLTSRRFAVFIHPPLAVRWP